LKAFYECLQKIPYKYTLGNKDSFDKLDLQEIEKVTDENWQEIMALLMSTTNPSYYEEGFYLSEESKLSTIRQACTAIAS
jgi:hypothetical protein